MKNRNGAWLPGRDRAPFFKDRPVRNQDFNEISVRYRESSVIFTGP